MRETNYYVIGLIAAIVIALVSIESQLNAAEIEDSPNIKTGLPMQSTIQYPEDGKQYHTTLLLRKHRRAEQLYDWFRTNPDLQILAKQTRFHVYEPNSLIYRERFSESCPLLPCILIQESDGTVLFKKSKGFTTPEELVAHIAQTLQLEGGKWYCPRCPRPKPLPNYPVYPDEVPRPVDPIPDTLTPSPGLVRPSTKPPFPWGLCVVAGFVGAGVVVLVNVLREVRAK